MDPRGHRVSCHIHGFSHSHAQSVTNDGFSAVCLEASAQPSHKSNYSHSYSSTNVQESSVDKVEANVQESSLDKVEAFEEAYP